MKTFGSHFRAFGVAVGMLAGGATAASAVPVDLELQLLIDSSGSIDTFEFADQVNGYAAAFNNATIQSLITDTTGGRVGSIGVQAVFWSGSGQQSILQAGGALGATNNWFLIDDAASASSFASDIASVTQPFSGQTNIAGAMNFGRGLFDPNGLEGTRLVMDVSGDGTENVQSVADVQAARDAALGTNGVDRINGLAITADVAGLGTYYADNVIGGTDAFVLSSPDFSTEFTTAINNKISFEVTNTTPDTVIPLPATAWMLFAGLGGMGALRRFRRAAA